ncbi:DNA cytosine methyltransferase [Dickeya chrysanthemi]|uniref:DNA cytosine methyltransferase n=1 Tax=Dickeya chrysanthemi TaxID=556 RepID=UPI001CF528D5|nr:DNA cytosine methyltransferase [Dickeya chrysanthemi]MCA7006072.1 DNA cytosine methyltransferase [Dickeya chrysanthemi]
MVIFDESLAHRLFLIYNMFTNNQKKDKLMNFIDLFSGCGGFSLGLLQSGMTGHLAIEKNEDAFSSLKKNLIEDDNFNYSWDEKLIPLKNHDIHLILNEHAKSLEKLSKEKNIDLIVGGPPCQGFSSAGRRNPADPRNQLAYDYLKIVSIINPKYIILENVKGIQYSFKDNTEAPVSSKIKEELSNLGYIPISMIEDCADWGVPQNRNRFILFGIKSSFFDISLSKEGLLFLGRELEESLRRSLNDFQDEFLKKKGLTRDVSVSDAISDLKSYDKEGNEFEKSIAEDAPGNRFKRISSLHDVDSPYQKLMRKGKGGLELNLVPSGLRLANHTPIVVEKFRNLLNHLNDPEKRKLYSIERRKSLPALYAIGMMKTKKTIMRVLDSTKPSVTVTTLPDDILHYDEPRILTVRECARLQSFPDWFEFSGNYTTGGDRRKNSCPKYTQVGNAVPPLMSEGIGLFMMNKMNDFIKNIDQKLIEKAKLKHP